MRKCVDQTRHESTDEESNDDPCSHYEPFSSLVLLKFILIDDNLLLVFIHLSSLMNVLNLARKFTLDFGLNVVLNQFLENLLINVIEASSSSILHSMEAIIIPIIITINVLSW